MTPSNDAWRAIFAALANDDVRPIAAALLAGDDPGPRLDALTAARRTRAVRTLTDAGLASERDGVLVARPEVFREVLRSVPVERATGIDRFIVDGRIDRWPSGAADRRELLAWAAESTVAPGEVVTESVVTQRLAAVFDDPVALRRYLVDEGLLERRRDGSEYARPA